jgi:maltoporin
VRSPRLPCWFVRALPLVAAALVSGSIFKVTLAPQITPKVAALSRPSLRAYATWAHCSDGFVGLVVPLLYGSEQRGFAAGVQLETWW